MRPQPIQSPPPSKPPAQGIPGPQGPIGPTGEQGPAGKDAVVDYDKIKQLIAEEVAKLPRPPSVDDIAAALLPKVDERISAAIAKIELCKCKPPTTPAMEQHLVVVAEKSASYWIPLADQIRRAQDTYKGIDVAAPPKNFTGPLPQIVLFENGIPRILATGSYGVSTVLSRVARGDAI